MNTSQALPRKKEAAGMSDDITNIDIFFDFTCPWCFIGHHQIAEAVQRSNINPSRIHYRAFQLNPSLPETGISRVTYRTKKFGTWEESLRRDAIVVAAVENNGLSIDFDNIIVTPNTRRAHRALKIAFSQESDVSALSERFFRVYFEEGRDIGDTQTLVELGSELGIMFTPEQLKINSPSLDNIIDTDIAAANHTGLTGVPHVVARNGNEENAISVTTAIKIIGESENI